MNVREMIAILSTKNMESTVFINFTEYISELTGCETCETEVESIVEIDKGILIQEF